MPTVARNVAGTFQRIIYTDSHDTAGDLNGGARLPAAIQAADPTGYYARKRSTLGAALVMTSPGIADDPAGPGNAGDQPVQRHAAGGLDPDQQLRGHRPPVSAT